MVIKIFFCTTFCLLFFSCINRDDYASVKGIKDAYAPIYMDSATLISQVKSNPPKPITTPGKIYLYKNFLFINEPGLGIHVFDNSDSTSPIPLCFISVPNISDIVTKDDILYVQTAFGLLFFNISALPAISNVILQKAPNYKYVIPRIPVTNQFQNGILRTSRIKVYFECVNPSKGSVVGWRLTKIENPKCYQ